MKADLLLRLVHLHGGFVEIQIDGCFQFTSVRHAARERAFARLADQVGNQRRPDEAGAKRIGLDDGLARGEIQNRHIATVPVCQQDLAEAMMGETQRDVEDEGFEVLRADGDGAGEAHVVVFEAIRNRRQKQYFVRDAPGGLIAYRADEKIVDIERQVAPVVFYRADGENTDGLAGDDVTHLRPGVVVVSVIQFGSKHSFSVCGSVCRCQEMTGQADSLGL